MHRVRADSLEKLETKGTRMRLSADAGSLAIVCPHRVRGNLLADTPRLDEHASEDLVEPGGTGKHLDVRTIRPGDDFCRS